MIPRLTLRTLLFTSATMLLAQSVYAEMLRTYIGTYTRGESEGIYVAEFDNRSGRFGKPNVAARSDNPSFLAVHPSQSYLYAVGEVSQFQGKSTGFVRAFAIDVDDGSLTPLNTQESGGAAPCHLVVDRRGKAVLVANYSGGSVASIAIDDNGRLGAIVSLHEHRGSSANKRRQNEPHAHSINLDPDNRFALAADLGIDQIVRYRYDSSTGRLVDDHEAPSAKLDPGAGPRHLAMHPSGDFAYVINELNSTITAFRYDSARGQLTETQTISTLPDDYQQTSHTAEVVVHPSGQFVYGSNRGHDSIAVFRVDSHSGKLRRVQIQSTQGQTPRNFAIDPSGRFLLAENQSSKTVVVMKIDARSGRLAPTGETLEVPSPVCIRFVPQGTR